MPSKKPVPKVEVICQQCGKVVYRWPYRAKTDKPEYCSYECYWASLRLPGDPVARKKQQQKEWAAANVEHRKAYGQEYRARNAERLKIAKTAYAQTHPEKGRAAEKRHRERLRDAMFEAYGNSCACCGERERTFLTLDHVNGGGNQHRKSLGSNAAEKLLRHLRNCGWPQDDFRILCWNCQFGTQQPDGCPHQRQ